jgi:N-acetylmuramoyl-L-alanine amidase
MRQITEAIVHCTATRPEWWASRTTSQKVREIRRWHVEDRGWSDIGYHYLIDRNGTVAEGRPIERDGAHVRGHNRGTIGISLFGGHGSNENDAFEDHFTPEQDAALRKLLAQLQDRYGFTKVSGHNEYAAKACPGFRVNRWLAKKSPAPAASRELVGGTVASVGVSGNVALEAVQSAATDIQGLLPYAESLKWVFVALTLAGVAFGLYARIDRQRRGRL